MSKTFLEVNVGSLKSQCNFSIIDFALDLCSTQLWFVVSLIIRRNEKKIPSKPKGWGHTMNAKKVQSYRYNNYELSSP